MEHRPDPLTDAEEALARGFLAEAAARCETLLSQGPMGPAREARMLLCLGRAYGRAGRFFEAIVAGRALLHLERRRGATGDVGTALAFLVVALLNAKAPERAAPLLDELEGGHLRAAEEEAPQIHRVVHQARASLALLDGDVAAAEQRFVRIRDMVARGLLPQEEAWFVGNGEFHVALARRDVPAMESLLARILSDVGRENVYVPEVTLRVGLAQAYADEGRLARAREQALAAARHLASVPGSSEVLVDDGAAVVRLLGDRLGLSGPAMEAARSVSAALLERVRAVQGSADALRELTARASDRLLADLREDFRETLLSFLRDVRKMLPPPPSEEEDAGNPDLLGLCAWCGSVRLAPGRWVPLARFAPTSAAEGVTHGICPTCRESAFPQ